MSGNSVDLSKHGVVVGLFGSAAEPFVAQKADLGNFLGMANDLPVEANHDLSIDNNGLA